MSADPKARENALVHPFSRLRLAALYETAGRIDQAIEQYKILATTWKNADPGLPEVVTVRKKLAKLKGRAPSSGGATVEAFFTLPFIGSL